MTNRDDIRKADELIGSLIENPPVDGVWIKSLNTFIDGTGQILKGMHPEANCEGRGCPIHHPSDHHLRHLKLQYRYSDIGVEPIIAERVCEHGVGHPDPDFIAFIEQRHGHAKAQAESSHGCDGCCSHADERMQAAVAIEEEARVLDNRPTLDPPTPEERLPGVERAMEGEADNASA